VRLIGRGAEANLYIDDGMVIKERIPKNYRVAELDRMLRTTRTRREARLLSAARRAGVPTPLVYDVDNPGTTLRIAHVPGLQVKKEMGEMTSAQRREIFHQIGTLAGKLHRNHIIHGDLTTSNMVHSGKRIFFIDFGLGEVSEAVEAKGTDLLVFKKSLRSTHHQYEEECLEAFMEGYVEEYPGAPPVLERLAEIEKRGRYFAR
jgi:Kae1-associated kinase Bud32